MSPAIPQATSPIHGLQIINDMTVVSGIPLLAVGILTMIWLIIYYRTKTFEGARTSIAAASFFSSIIGIGLAVLDLLPDGSLMVMIAISILSMVPLLNR